MIDQKATTYDEDNQDEIGSVLVGRRIIQAEQGSFDYPGRWGWDERAQGRLVLDDGTTLYLSGNNGWCSCGAGDYYLDKLSTVDNIITSVRVESDPRGDEEDGEGVYRIFVVADATEINIAEFIGDDGNGYYGTGFNLTVVRSD